MPISVVINTKNAATTIKRTLDSVSFAEEIIVVDMHSVDQTAEIVRNFGAKVFLYKDVGFVEPAREFALSKATQEWVLVLDADEIIPEDLATELIKISESTSDSDTSDCYYLPRRNMIWGRSLAHTGWWPDYNLRFFKKGHVQWPAELHSVPVTRGTVAQIPAKNSLAIQHFNYPTVSSYIQRLDRYSTIQADEKSAATPKVSSIQLVQAFRHEFVRRFAAEQGFLDKEVGTGLSLWQAISEVTVLLKIWENQGSTAEKSISIKQVETEFSSLVKELRYWYAEYQISQTAGLSNIYWRLRRKMQW